MTMPDLDAQQTTQSIGRRYLLEGQLGQGGMGTVYKALDRLTGQPVALKHVTIHKANLQFATRATDTDVEVALAQEFKTLASLRHPHIISVLDYGFDENRQPYFTMELLEDAQDILEYGQLLSEDQQIEILVQILQALAYLHRRGIIHRDLKPDNILVVGGQVKVLDFGLAIAQEYLRAASDTVTGTLAYMAPEVLRGEPADVKSDLYAVGIIAYQLFAERFPYDLSSISQLVSDIVSTMPDVESLGLDPVLGSALSRLLAKDPADRPHSAQELIKVYIEATQQELRHETDTIRESFLQAARFVGRDDEMTTLTNALERAQDGSGSTWLVGGESGAGKSRLLDELRTLALVQGALAVYGGAISDGGRPYEMWREPLRRLILETDLNDTAASVLKPLVPDINTLLERNIADATDLEPQAAQDRLFNTVEMLLRQQDRPVVIVLEDFHWAGSESILMLERLSRLHELPLLIVGSYRDDEIPGLPQKLPDVQSLKLQRLSENGIQKLSESMLGEAGRRPEVVELLQRETEGNIFFIVEVVRALAEEAGQLDLIGSESLPDTIFAGGVERIVQRRLQKVPENAKPMLQYAAIIGRQVDLKLLRQLHETFDEAGWLAACADAAVLEVQDDRWRFAHDKLREALLRELTAEQDQQLHHRVAEAIETVYQDNLAPYYAVLANHWQHAQVNDKTIGYLEKAGTQALENFANQEALQFLTRALELADKAAVSQVRRARWHRKIGQAHWGLGNLATLREHVEKALDLYHRPVPSTESQLGLKLLKQATIQTAHRLRAPSQTNTEEEIILEIVRACKLLGQAYFFLNESNLTVYVTLEQINLAERIPPSPELAEAYANMCLIVGLVPLHSLARVYQRRAIETAEALGDTYMIGQTSSVISLYYLGLGQWDTARQLIERSTTIADEVGDTRLWESVSGVHALTYSFEGNFQKAIEIFEQVYTSSRRSDNTQTYLWGMLGQAENLLPGGQLDQAWDFLEQAMTMPIHNFGRDSEIRTNALVALTRFRMGKHQQALEAAERAAEFMAQSPPISSWLLLHYAAIAEIYLTLWESGSEPLSQSRESYRDPARAATKMMTRFARVFPIGKARASLYQGWVEHLEGRPDKAQQTWAAALPVASTLGMPYDEALIRVEMGRHLPATEPDRQLHLSRAAQIFNDLKATHDADRVQTMMNIKPDA